MNQDTERCVAVIRCFKGDKLVTTEKCERGDGDGALLRKRAMKLAGMAYYSHGATRAEIEVTGYDLPEGMKLLETVTMEAAA